MEVIRELHQITWSISSLNQHTDYKYEQTTSPIATYTVEPVINPIPVTQQPHQFQQ